MNKQDLISKVANVTSVSKSEIEEILTEAFAVIRTNMINDEKTTWSGFGTFETSQRKARQGRNPRTGEALQIPASRSAKFKPAKQLKESLKS